MVCVHNGSWSRLGSGKLEGSMTSGFGLYEKQDRGQQKKESCCAKSPTSYGNQSRLVVLDLISDLSTALVFELKFVELKAEWMVR